MRTALITGTSSGIGRSTALRLANAGWRVYAGVRNTKDGDALVAELANDDQLTPVLLDVTDAAARAETVAQITSASSGLDALINNAGTVSAGPLECLNIENIRRDIDTNLISAIALTQACLPLLRASKGRVINIGSIQDTLTPPYFGGYTISKWGMRGFHQSLRLELRPWEIECVLIVPGGVKTRIWDAVPSFVTDLDDMTPDARDLYRPLAEAMQKASTQVAEDGVDADVVAAAIEKALTYRRPKPEILVGADAKFLMRPISWLPTRLRELVEAKVFGLP